MQKQTYNEFISMQAILQFGIHWNIKFYIRIYERLKSSQRPFVCWNQCLQKKSFVQAKNGICIYVYVYIFIIYWQILVHIYYIFISIMVYSASDHSHVQNIPVKIHPWTIHVHTYIHIYTYNAHADPIFEAMSRLNHCEFASRRR